jgi:hypothetical protein
MLHPVSAGDGHELGVDGIGYYLGDTAEGRAPVTAKNDLPERLIA